MHDEFSIQSPERLRKAQSCIRIFAPNCNKYQQRGRGLRSEEPPANQAKFLSPTKILFSSMCTNYHDSEFLQDSIKVFPFIHGQQYGHTINVCLISKIREELYLFIYLFFQNVHK